MRHTRSSDDDPEAEGMAVPSMNDQGSEAPSGAAGRTGHRATSPPLQTSGPVGEPSGSGPKVRPLRSLAVRHFSVPFLSPLVGRRTGCAAPEVDEPDDVKNQIAVWPDGRAAGCRRIARR